MSIDPNATESCSRAITIAATVPRKVGTPRTIPTIVPVSRLLALQVSFPPVPCTDEILHTEQGIRLRGGAVVRVDLR